MLQCYIIVNLTIRAFYGVTQLLFNNEKKVLYRYEERTEVAKSITTLEIDRVLPNEI